MKQITIYDENNESNILYIDENSISFIQSKNIIFNKESTYIYSNQNILLKDISKIEYLFSQTTSLQLKTYIILIFSILFMLSSIPIFISKNIIIGVIMLFLAFLFLILFLVKRNKNKKIFYIFNIYGNTGNLIYTTNYFITIKLIEEIIEEIRLAQLKLN